MCSRPSDQQAWSRLSPFALALAVIGLTSITAQVLIIREIGAVFYGNELSMGIILAVWLLSVAAGAWLPGRSIDRIARGDVLLSLGLTAAGLLPIFQLLLVRTGRWWLNLTPGALADLGNITLTVVIVLFPLCFCLGLLFRLGARLFAENGQSAAVAYVWEAAGAALGGILFAFVLVRWGNSFGIALLLAAINWGAVFYIQMRSGSVLSRYFYLLISITGLLAVLLVSDSWNHSTLCWQYPDLLFAADSVYGRVVVTGRDSQRVFYENGLIMFDTQSLAAEETVHLPLLAHPSPHRLLLIGSGVGGSLREALKHALESIDYVELDALIVETAHQFLPPEDAKWLEDPRVHIINQDGREYLSTNQEARPALRDSSTSTAQYDAIIIDLPEPSTGQLNRFYTLEFYRLARAVLAPDGILAFGLPSSENYLNRELKRRNGSIHAALREVFPHVIVLPGDRNVFLASGIPISDNPEIWTARLYERGLQTKQISPPYLRFLLTTERYAELRQTLEAEQGPINRDFEPICYYYDMILWLSRFYGEMGPIFYLPTAAHLWPLAAVTVLLGIVLRWRRQWRVPGAVFLAGLAGMSAEIVLLLAFQALYGNVYLLVSLIAAAFMVGTACGAGWVERQSNAGRLVLIALLGGLGLYVWLLPLVLQVSAPIAPFTVPILALIGGALVGATFPVGVSLTAGNSGFRVGLVYTADLVGGSLGALLTAVLWVPLLGIPTACALIGLWMVIGAVVQW